MSASREFPEPINQEHIGLAAQVEKRLEPNLPPLLRVHEGERLSRRKSGREEQRGREKGLGCVRRHGNDLFFGAYPHICKQIFENTVPAM